MQGKDVKVLTTTPSGRVDCPESLTALLTAQGVLITSVGVSYNGNEITYKLLRSDGVTLEAKTYVPIPTQATQNPTTGLIEMKDSAGKVLFSIPQVCYPNCAP